MLLLTTACPAPPSSEQVPANTIEQAKGQALASLPITPEERARMQDIPVEQGPLPSGRPGRFVSGSGTIVFDGAQLAAFAPLGSQTFIDILALLLEHEYYHAPPPAGGGSGPESGGVEGGSDCRHIGLQYWSVLRACEKATAASAAGDVEGTKRLCKFMSGLARPFTKRGKYRLAAHECTLAGDNGGGAAHAGPPAFGYDYPPIASNQYCEACTP